MSHIVEEVIAANNEYVANFGNKGELPMPPGRSFAILTCMDARLDPAQYAGLAEGDAHVIQNAGARASVDASGWHDHGAGPGSVDGKYINWLTISDKEKSVVEDVQRIRACSMVPSSIPIYGYIYDCKTGK